MSIATVVTRGYGSFGSVNKLPTRGYSIGATAVAIDCYTLNLLELDRQINLSELDRQANLLELDTTINLRCG